MTEHQKARWRCKIIDLAPLLQLFNPVLTTTIISNMHSAFVLPRTSAFRLNAFPLPRTLVCHPPRRRYTHSPSTPAPHALAKPPVDANERLLSYATNQGVDREIAQRVLSVAQRAVRDWSVNSSEFLTPPESAAMQTAVSSLAGARALPWGGYDDAERRCLFVGHAETITSDEQFLAIADEQLVLLKILGNFEYEKGTSS